ncbi:MAG TPA: hypothetical protein VK638_04850 [Edaphobacter sp.]|nr:hypothetical protein [Edaphobacter sp.]
MGQVLVLIADVLGYFLAESIRRLEFFAFLPRGKLDFGKHQTYQIAPKLVKLDFLVSLVDLITDFLNPSTFGAWPKRIKLIESQFDFQFPALQTPGVFVSLEIAIADFS